MAKKLDINDTHVRRGTIEFLVSRYEVSEEEAERLFTEHQREQFAECWSRGALHMHPEADLSQNPFRAEES